MKCRPINQKKHVSVYINNIRQRSCAINFKATAANCFSFLSFFPDAGKYLHLVGLGGCRGDEWQSEDGDWPKFKERQSLDACAMACAKNDDCSAFHVLREDEAKKTFECLLFDHDDVITVPRLGGACFELEDQPDGVEEKEVEVKIGKILLSTAKKA